MIYVFSLPGGAQVLIPAASLPSATAMIAQTHTRFAFVGIAFQPR